MVSITVLFILLHMLTALRALALQWSLSSSLRLARLRRTVLPLHQMYARVAKRSRILADIPPTARPLSLDPVDRYTHLRRLHRTLWWHDTLLHPDHFEDILRRIQPFLSRTRHTLSDENRLLLVVEWLRFYPPLARLGMDYGLHESTAWRTIEEIVPILAVVLRPSSSDLCVPEKHASFARCEDFPAAIGVIDCTHHAIERPERNEELYYRKDQGNHSITTQVITSLTGKPIHVSSGYPGSCHDLRVFRDSGAQKHLAAGEVLLADQGYLRGPFISPYSFQDSDPTHEYFNKRISHYRVVVEQTNRFLKRWQSIGQRWRYKRALLAQTVHAVAGICAEQLEQYPISNILPRTV